MAFDNLKPVQQEAEKRKNVQVDKAALPQHSTVLDSLSTAKGKCNDPRPPLNEIIWLVEGWKRNTP